MSIMLCRIRSMLTFGLAITYLTNVFIASAVLNNFNIFIMVVVILLSLPAVTGSSRIIGYASLAVSIILLLIYQAPLNIWKQAIEENIYLVVMFTLVPLLGIPIEHGGYSQALQGTFQRYVNTNKRFYLFVSFISAFMGVLVSLAVVPLVYQITKVSAKSKNTKLLATAISRGFTTCTIWAPTTAAIALIVQVTDIKWTEFFPSALFCGIICGFVGYILNRLEDKRLEDKKTDLVDISEKPFPGEFKWAKVIELCGFGIVLIVSIAAISILADLLTIIVVSLAALIFPVIWMGLLKRLPIYLQVVKKHYFKVSLPKLKNEFVLFVAAGFLATSISYSHLGDYIPLLLSYIVGNNAFLFSVLVIFTSILLSMLGVHPIITVVIIGNTVDPSFYNISSTYLALILAISWAMSVTVSPTAATLIAISGITGESTITIGSRWNLVYVFTASALMILVITLLKAFGLL
ncbi:MAG: C4-dicarboxylate ABC transporter [Peptococcaceae bacterium]|nr:C4-dicarboxylate ABC transporter [Peptococcaceae bacterium]